MNWRTNISSRDHLSLSIFIKTRPILFSLHLLFITFFLIPQFFVRHISFNPSDSGLERHVMLWSEATGVLPLLCILLFVLLLLPQLLECDDVLTLLLIYELIHLLFNLRSQIFLVELPWINKHWYFYWLLRIDINVGKRLLLLFIVYLLHVVENHQAEGEGVEYVQELVAWKILINRQVQGCDEAILQVFTIFEWIIQTERRSQSKQKISNLVQFNIRGSLYPKIKKPKLHQDRTLPRPLWSGWPFHD